MPTWFQACARCGIERFPHAGNPVSPLCGDCRYTATAWERKFYLGE